jgi:hypothetical protein
VHTPTRHVYVRHIFDPLHGVPSGAFGFEHNPVMGSHVPATWQPSLGGHATDGVPLQTPAAQAYVSHLFAPVQIVPSGALVCGEHVPVPAEHVPATWQTSVAVHVTMFVPVQVPFWHAYESHLLLPEHIVPFCAFVCVEHVPLLVLHEPAT